MKQLWTGEEVTFAGQYAQVTKLRMGLTPVQKPHPPIVMGCQSKRATARAARLTDGVFFGPQVGWADIGQLIDTYRQTRAEAGQSSPGVLGASRALLLGKDQEDAARIGRAYLERTFANYRAWEMQKLPWCRWRCPSIVPPGLDRAWVDRRLRRDSVART